MVASLVGDPARANMLTALLSGRALTASELSQEAGVTPEGLAELVDASERFDPAPIAAKLAEIDVAGRNLRIFETSDPNLLLVKEKDEHGHHDYAIERDEGLVADLKLYGEAP